MPEQALPSRPHRRGPKPLAQDAATLLRGHLKARGFAQAELVTRWAEIAGSQLAAHCVPLRVTSHASGGQSLTLLADDRAALELQHQAPKLIERINAYLGRTEISKIKVVAGDVQRSRAPATPRRTPTAAEIEVLGNQVASIADPGLRDALARLGRHALSESPATAVYKR